MSAMPSNPLAAPPADESARVRLGASAHSQADILRRLAHDPAVTVRAAVAMNTAAPPEADQILARDRDERVRILLARKLAAMAPGLTNEHQEDLSRHVLSTLVTLVEDEAERVRAAISDVVKEMPDASRDLILRLAYDGAISVSDPVIRLSPLLTPEDLLALIAAPPTAGTVVAVARRPNLSEAVSDAIAATADNTAIRALLANASAAIREATLDALIARAAKHEDWHEPLVQRPRLPARAARALSELVATHLLAKLAGRSDLDPALIEELQRRLAARLEVKPAARAETELSAEEALLQARALYEAGSLDEETVLAVAKRGEARFAAALIATAAQVPIAAVDRASALRSAKAIVSLTWKAGFSMRVAGPLQALLGRLAPAAILPAGPGGNFPLATEEMRWQLEFLGRKGQ